MLSKEENEFITRVGPGTPVGNLMRQYWVPALLCTELPHADSDPVRVMLLGERLVAFRNTDGRIGLMPHNCPHKGASLFFGRCEERGIRCLYHGWKFDVDGNCIDMPNEPSDSTFKDKVHIRAYPCVENAGVVWTYMGPRKEPPPFPWFEVLDGPEDEIVASAYFVDCNWLQSMEGDQDLTHFGFLHSGHAQASAAPEGSALREALRDRAPRFKVLDTAGGALSGAYREMPDGEHTSWWLQSYLFPFHTLTGVGIGIGDVTAGMMRKRASLLAKVPMDDEHTLSFSMSLGLEDTTAGAPANAEISKTEYTEQPLHPNSTDWFGRFRWIQNASNDYLIDRESQRSGETYTGVAGVVPEDAMMTESMGPIIDRTHERLGTADIFQLRVRRRIMRAARALANEQVVPPGVDEPGAFRLRAGYVELPRGSDLVDAAEVLRKGWEHLSELDQRPWVQDPKT